MPGDAQTDAPTRIIPERHEHNRAYWTGGSNGELLIPRCTSCALWVSPPTSDCPECNGELMPTAVSGRGEVFTYTVNYHPFNPTVPLPYAIAIVQLDEQDDLRIAANIVDCEPDSIHIGMPVQVAFERQDVGDETVYAPVFAPVTRR
jgi:uncharacterized protein